MIFNTLSTINREREKKTKRKTNTQNYLKNAPCVVPIKQSERQDLAQRIARTELMETEVEHSSKQKSRRLVQILIINYYETLNNNAKIKQKQNV